MKALPIIAISCVLLQADNLIFKDRKLNIGPAIRKQQAFPKLYGEYVQIDFSQIEVE
jgi:hypothetical protein